MNFNLNNKTALITGSSRGIGLQISKKLHEHGCSIGLNSRQKKELETESRKLEKSSYFVGDVTNKNDAEKTIKSFIEHYSKLDILICNVGNGSSVPPGSETLEEWEKSIKQNLFSATNIIQFALPHLKETKGCIVCISSICGIECIPNAPVTYSASKAALNAFVKGISRPLGKDGVRINAIAPGNILFKGSNWEKKINTDSDTVYSMIEKEVPLGSFGNTEDIANLACYLSSSISNFITGSIFTIDGGQVRS
tara:strand:- start:148 stop:903 length:756 start_codon:yes stop_codon:yes gene_type:complete